MTVAPVSPLRFFITLLLAWSLIGAPFAHALSMSFMARDTPLKTPASAERSVPPCHLHAAAQAQVDPAVAHPTGDCCCHPGKVCHCAAAVALPATAFSLAAQTPAGYAESVPTRIPSPHTLPETPPPRRS